jgi:hypothetical protein
MGCRRRGNVLFVDTVDDGATSEFEETIMNAADRRAAPRHRPTRFSAPRSLLMAMAFALLLTAFSEPDAAAADTAEARVGRVFWARPPLTGRSVEFHADVRLRERSPVYEKARFRIEAIEFDGAFPEPTALYRVRMADGRRAFIPVAEFERQLYHELRWNEVAVAPTFEPPLGVGIQVYLFERSAVFEADPDLIWARVKNQGPRTFIRRPAATP